MFCNYDLQVNQRDHIKSKAFHTKLQMVNKEKEQIDRKANGMWLL